MSGLETVPAKSIATRTKNRSWVGADYNVNIYQGCRHGRICCDSIALPGRVRYLPFSAAQ